MVEIGLNTWRHLVFGLRALLFLRVDPARLGALGPELVIITLLSLAAVTLQDWFKVDEVSFSAWGVTAYLATTALFAAFLLLLCAGRPGLNLASFLAALTAAEFFFTLALTAIRQAMELGLEDWPQLDRAQGLVELVGLVWFFIAIGVFAARATKIRPRRFGVAVVTATLASAFILPMPAIVAGARPTSPGLLQAALNFATSGPARMNRERPDALDAEATFARQPQLLDAQLDGLASSQPGRGEVYFVGMATYASQDVFKREVTSARAIMDERFATKGHSILMVNHADTVETLPLATLSNLERVLWRLAQRMDSDNDVLVLFITSHGSEGFISVDFPGLPLNGVTPERLAGILARTGIRNTVLILSACHAGSFIPALSGPDTLIMAAARTDRTSFGCSNERDWTYFGDALFHHALGQTHSFTAAFGEAKALVANWEREQKLTPPSEPQIAVGGQIAAKLDRIARRLDTATVSTTPDPPRAE